MIKLTKYVTKGGCACKLGPHILDKALQGVTFPTSERLIVGMEGREDAGVYALDESTGLVQTTDFFTPIVDDPYMFGQIAATNSISDVYAMGGRPITAMNLVGFPVPLVESGALAAVLEGASDVLRDAGVAVVGGHSIENETPIFGLAVTGLVDPHQVWRNRGAQVDDVLVLTKPIGTGLMSNALKGGLFKRGVQEAMHSMIMTNRIAQEVANQYTIHSCTDVTGFSLMGHGREMADASKVSFSIHFKAIPLFTDVLEAAQMGLVPASAYGNRKALGEGISFAPSVPACGVDICFDPQTSGGLLFALPEIEADHFIKSLHDAGLVKASAIGHVIEREEYSIYVN